MKRTDMAVVALIFVIAAVLVWAGVDALNDPYPEVRTKP